MKKIFVISVILCVFGTFLEGCVTTTTESEPVDEVQEQVDSDANAEIIQMQEEIVTLRQRIFEDTQIKIANAQATQKDLIEARANLSGAKIKLAQFESRDDLIIQELQSLVQFYVNTRGQLLEQLESGTGKGKELYEIEIALMEANIQLKQAIAKLYPSGVQGIRAE